MSSLFRSLNNFSHKREIAVKECLINTLSENAREIQFEFKESGKDYLELTDATNSLCTTLEAIFLHGLKDSFLWQTISAISNDVDRRPEPSFWSPLLVFLHKQVIEQIQSLTQITSEIGCCRSWIRLSLNESVFSSYLNNLRKNSSALNPYYKRYAFVKDADYLDLASKIIEGVEACIQINLPVNSSLLNQWPNYTLQLAGIWTPPLKSCPISSGVDVASSMTEVVTIPTPKPLPTNEFFASSISNSPFTSHSPFSRTSNFAAHDLSHQENLEIFLQKVDEMEQISEEAEKAEEEKEADGQDIKESQEHKEMEETIKRELVKEQQPKGNSLNNLMNGSWSSEPRDEDNENRTDAEDPSKVLLRSNSMTSSLSSLKSPIDRYSYNMLLKKHEKNRQVDWTDVWEQFESTVGISSEHGSEHAEQEESERGSELNFEFEVIQSNLMDKFTIAELQDLVEKLCKLAHEPGLDSQGFLCKSCGHPLGIGFASAQVCSFSGNYFCESCMSVELFMIPAKIIFNWDFRKYYVSKKAASFLREFQCHPFIDLKLLNPEIYQSTEEMATLQSLRIRLNFIRAYLYTCCASSIQDLQKHVFSKEYLFEHIHKYSIGDLTMIQRGVLASQLQKAVNFGEQHILKCNLCSVKGFICEICNSPKVLYPFHIDTTFRCSLCGAVFHASCLNDSQPCPKCERKRKREDLPLQEAVQAL